MQNKTLLKKELKKGLIGIEKENVRVDKTGNLALTKHPETFGSKDGHPYIQADFSESQIEMITPPLNSISEAYHFLENIHDVISVELENEFLWPSSMPPILPADESEIPIAIFENETAMDYRRQLAEKYGRKRQLISGVHANISFTDQFFILLGKLKNSKLSLRDIKDQTYLQMSRQFLKLVPQILEKTGASSVAHSTYSELISSKGEQIAKDSYTIAGEPSIRNSEYGYTNNEVINVSFDTIEKYVADLNVYIKKGILQNEKEFYCPVRLKSHGDNLESLLNNGVDYLEIRLLDLDPFEKIGISKRSLYLIRAILLLAAFEKIDENNPFEQTLDFVKKWELGDEYVEALTYYLSSEQPLAKKVISRVRASSFVDFNLTKAQLYKNQTLQSQFRFSGADDLELSTQILLKEAIRKGVGIEFLDRRDNFIALSDGTKTEYVKQATKTSLDCYSTILMMENKHVTKQILKKHQINVPEGIACHSIAEVMEQYPEFKNKPIVIKPNSTNFGIGITIFPDNYRKMQVENAAKLAFSEDDTILVERFYPGKEYRFLVINNEVVGILHRVPANVTGDGSKTIRQLVAEKNEDPLRGQGYKTPLEKIQLGEEELVVLNSQNKTFEYVPKTGETVYLRENSNISTGGDSLDFTDEVHPSYHEIAIKAAKAVGAKLCGVDIIIDDLNQEATDDNYVIIELNFNPAIHIHCFPYKGKNRHAGEKVLKALFPKL